MRVVEMPNTATFEHQGRIGATMFGFGRHTFQGFVVHHTDMSHRMDDGTVYGERSEVWLTPDQIIIRGTHCLRRHLKRQQDENPLASA